MSAWHHALHRNFTEVADAATVALLDAKRAYYLALPREMWRTAEQIEGHSIAVLGDDGRIYFITGDTEPLTTLSRVRTFIRFTWWAGVVGWLPMGE